MIDDKNGGPNYLSAWRRFRHLSQAQLAEAVGTSLSMISHLETGERGLSSKWLRRLAPALGTTPGFLLDHDPYDLPPDIMDIWNRGSAEQQQQIAAVAETIVTFKAKSPEDDLAELLAAKGKKRR